MLSRARGGMALMPEQGTRPVNRYLPPRLKDKSLREDKALTPVGEEPKGFLAWLDKALEAL